MLSSSNHYKNHSPHSNQLTMNTILLTIATVFAGLMAGLFYTWSISVTNGLAQVNDHNYLNAFQAMNRAILNPAFFIAFFGQAILLPILTHQYYHASSPSTFRLVLIAMLLYWLGCMAVTMFGNVPLNNTLEVLQVELMTPHKRLDFRLGFEQKWNRLNWIRTISTLFSLICLIIACVQHASK